MIAKDRPADTRIQSIKNDTEFISTTTHSTFNLLRAILGLSLESDPQNAKRNPNLKNVAKTSGRRIPESHQQAPKHPRNPKRMNFEIYENPEPEPISLQNEDKRKFATEIFNVTLKNLTAAAKESKYSHVAGEAIKKTDVDKDTTPLKEFSPNKKAHCAPGKTIKKTPQTPPEPEGIHLRATADCAVACLDVLLAGLHVRPRINEKPTEASIQLDRGAIILVDKLVTLKLKQHAIWVAQNLKSRLEYSQIVDKGNWYPPENLAAQESRIESLLCLKIDITDKKAFASATCLQSHLIRLAIAQGKSSISPGILKCLQLTESSGPCGILLEGVRRQHISPQKASEQLKVVSQAITNLSAAQHSMPCSGNYHELVFRLRSVALEIRCHALRLCQDSDDFLNNIWAHFARQLRKYRDEAGKDPSQAYTIARVVLESLQRASNLSDLECNLPFEVSEILAEMAFRAERPTDASALLTPFAKEMDERHDIKALLFFCRMAALQLMTWRADCDASQVAIERAISALKGALRGSSYDIGDLLLFGTRLRKAALGVAIELEQLMIDGNIDQRHSRLQVATVRAIYAFQHLLLRYQKSMAARNNDPQKSSEHASAFEHVQQKTLESVISISKFRNMASPILWKETDSALCECLLVAESMKQSTQTNLSGDVGELYEHIASKISAIYWYWLEQKNAHQDVTPDDRDLMLRSIGALDSCSPKEKVRSFLPQKYERLGNYHVSRNDFRAAYDALTLAVTLLITNGTLLIAFEDASCEPNRILWSDTRPETQAISRCLTALAKIALRGDLRAQNTKIFFDDHSLPGNHRALMLSKQVLASTDSDLSAATRELVVQAGREVLSLYDKLEFDVCRLQFACDLLMISSRNDTFPTLEILEGFQHTLLRRSKETLKHRFLSSFEPALLCIFWIFWVYQTGSCDLNHVREAMKGLERQIKDCADVTTLQQVVPDCKVLGKALSSIADYASLIGSNETAILALNLRRCLLEIDSSQQQSELAACLIKLADAYSSKGLADESRWHLAATEKLFEGTDVAPDTKVLLLLTRSEHLLNAEKFEDCSFALLAAGKAFCNAFQDFETANCRLRCQRDFLLSRACYVASRLAFGKGDLPAAFSYARQCVRLTSGIWSSIEKYFNDARDQRHQSSQSGTLGAVAERISNLSLSTTSTTNSTPRGVLFWSYVDVHVRALLLNSLLCEHAGLYQDSNYYSEQACQLSKTTHSKALNLRSRTATALLQRRADQCETTPHSLARMMEDLASLEINMDRMASALNVIKIALLDEKFDKVQIVINDTKSAMKAVHAKSVPENASGTLTTTRAIQNKNPKKLKEKCKRGAPKSHVLPQLSMEKKCTVFSLDRKIDALSESENEAFNWFTQQLRDLEFQTALLQFEPIQVVDDKCLYNPELMLLKASFSLDLALKSFSADAMHCVLEETTLGLPSHYQVISSKDIVITGRKIKMHELSGASAKATSQIKVSNKHTSQSGKTDLLKDAHELVVTKYDSLLPGLPSHALHRRQRLLSKITLLKNAIESEVEASYPPSLFMRQCLAPKSWIRQREHWIMKAEDATVTYAQAQIWPMNENQKISSARLSIASEPDFVEKLPSSWILLSISLSDDQKDLVVCRQVSGRHAFSLRIPLLRSNMEGLDHEEFSFHEARKELREIIHRANSTAHDARGQADKQVRKSWWAEREALDKRLETLLVNIEHLWFGGFCGILSQHEADEDLFSQFAKLLSKSLDNHLPSRQKPGTAKRSQVQVHSHVLELFLSLGHPDASDLDDCITDLLYFVVDILQLSGEHNAYDEIDFDMLLMEVSDALRAYHNGYAKNKALNKKHTILILDKELHCFPWESLPCMSGQSISRMPCLDEVDSRLTSIGNQNEGAHFYSISRNLGAYVLNPSGDLKSTQDTFRECLTSGLPEFTSIINRTPSEDEFRFCLQDHDLFLYFGHGSGAQYIRGRTIKKLERCAVTFLMGCSSAKMTECGVYEPYGVPWNYMSAGSPAVIGTLWDVTDKDIDRFAMRSLVNWGLLDQKYETELMVSSKSKDKIRARNFKVVGDNQRCETSGKVTLDEAVVKARDACVLRFLNGAAPVIYGVPVALA